MKTVGMTQLRQTIQRLTENGKKDISNALLYETFGMEDEASKSRLRRRITDMVRRSELIRLKQGLFQYNPKAQPQRSGEMYERIWRLVRTKEPGWSYRDMAARTRASYSLVNKYCNWLLEEGYLARHGKDGNTRLYRCTGKARELLRTPWPPVAPRDPFEAERSAACRLVRLMMERNPYFEGVRSKIVRECGIILTRFTPKEDEHES